MSKNKETLLEILEHIYDFGDERNEQFIDPLFKIQENDDVPAEVSDAATDLMLYCENDELGPLRDMKSDKVKEKIKATLRNPPESDSSD